MSASLDLTPAPGAAPMAGRVLRHAATETKLLLRNGEQLLLALVIPVGILVVGHLLAPRFEAFGPVAPSVLALALWSSAFASVAIATGFERRYGVLERLAATPLGRTGLILGKAGAVLTVAVGQLVVLSLVALALGWRPVGGAAASAAAVVGVLLAVVAFSALALALAGRLRAEATLAAANLIYVALAALGGLVVPLSSYPDALAAVVRWLPTAALGDLLRGWSAGIGFGLDLLVLLGWAVVGVLLAWKGHRWMS